MTADKGRQLWAEDVADVLGVTARTVVFSASKTRRTPVGKRKPTDLPLPAGRRRRTVHTTTGQPRRVLSPWWWEADIQACYEAREIGGLLGLDRGPGGQFLPVPKAAS